VKSKRCSQSARTVLVIFFLWLCFMVMHISEARPSNGASRKSGDGVWYSRPTNVCLRKVERRVCEILDLLARSDNDIECADVCWLMDRLESVIRALDGLQSGCCDLRQVNISEFFTRTFLTCSIRWRRSVDWNTAIIYYY